MLKLHAIENLKELKQAYPSKEEIIFAHIQKNNQFEPLTEALDAAFEQIEQNLEGLVYSSVNNRFDISEYLPEKDKTIETSAKNAMFYEAFSAFMQAKGFFCDLEDNKIYIYV